MSDTSGPTLPTPFAQYDHASCSWRTFQATFPWGSDEFLETWPKAGMTHAGFAYELPTLAPPTDASASSSLLPTPMVPNGGRTMSDADVLAKGNTERGKRQVDLGAVLRLLPTPVANDDHKTAEAHLAAKVRSGAGEVITSLDVMARQAAQTGEWSVHLLPAPTVDDASNVTRDSGEYQSLTRRIRSLVPGALTSQPSTDGSPSSDDAPPTLWTD